MNHQKGGCEEHDISTCESDHCLSVYIFRNVVCAQGILQIHVKQSAILVFMAGITILVPYYFVLIIASDLISDQYAEMSLVAKEWQLFEQNDGIGIAAEARMKYIF